MAFQIRGYRSHIISYSKAKDCWLWFLWPFSHVSVLKMAAEALIIKSVSKAERKKR